MWHYMWFWVKFGKGTSLNQKFWGIYKKITGANKTWRLGEKKQDFFPILQTLLKNVQIL